MSWNNRRMISCVLLAAVLLFAGSAWACSGTVSMDSETRQVLEIAKSVPLPPAGYSTFTGHPRHFGEIQVEKIRQGESGFDEDTGKPIPSVNLYEITVTAKADKSEKVFELMMPAIIHPVSDNYTSNSGNYTIVDSDSWSITYPTEPPYTLKELQDNAANLKWY